ncbi:MAG TPA: ABC transporter permease [Stellaceae bacterium]|jgi:ABC-2 type transport system permease protein|nr:ABC transporter permease [Stellaceae bacterium]
MRDIYLITMNEIRVTIRNPFWAFSGLFQPIIYLLLFGPLLNGVAGVRGFPGAANAIQFFAPGLLIMNALFGSGFEGFTLRDKLDSGFLERLRVTPISRLSLALGFILQSSVNLVVQSILLLIVALFFGLKFDPLGALVLLVLVVLIAITMASISYRLGLMIREGGILAGIVNTFVLPAMILSGIMLPISFGPPIIQMAARIDPFYYAVNASRVLIEGNLGDSSVVSALAIFAALAALCLAIFIRGMREAVA